MSQSVVLRLLTTALMLAAGLPADVYAQGTPPRAGMRQGSPRMSDQQREELEKRFTRRIDELVTQRLRLSEEQQVKLRDVASRTEQARRVLRREEFALRTSLRDEMRAGDKASEAKVSDLLEQMPRLERRKLDLLEAEQRDLAKFLSPIQRARYFGLQDELRRGMQDLQRRRMGMEDSTTGTPGSRGSKRRGPPPAA
jgi:protein CpxP